MLKQAYEEGIKIAYEEAGLTPEQMGAVQRLSALGGGIAGAGLGGVLGKYLGSHIGEAFDWDPEMSSVVGSGIGALLGGGLGGYAGSQFPLWKFQRREKPEESALGVLPVADYIGVVPNYSDYIEEPLSVPYSFNY